MKNLIKLFLALLVISLAFSCEKNSDDPDPKINTDPTDHVSTVDVVNPILGTVSGTSTLTRTDTGITVNYKSTGLKPGYAYTLWWVIWNSPGECLTPNECGDPDDVDFFNPATEVDLLYATGLVVGNNGEGNFLAHLKIGDDSDSENELMELPVVGGLHVGNAFNAEVHLVLRSHGPVIADMVAEQIGGYVGGCTDPFAFLPFSEIPDEVGECGDIEYALHPPVK
jgi:hypothetical protein